MARMPKDSVLFDLYTAQGERLAAVGRLIADLVDTKPSKREKLVADISALETEADEILGKIIDRADSMLITPFDRGDIHDLANTLDDAVDCIEGAAELTVLHAVEDFPKGVEQLADCVRRLTELTGSNLARLRSLKDMDFYYSEADKIEDEGDRIHRRIIARLFSGDYDALTVLRVQGVVDSLEASLDHMAKVARIVRSVASQES
jgi:predicted phosphate transport protein (TIGR00153 family)